MKVFATCFFCWNILVIETFQSFVSVYLKLTTTVFISLYFQTFWPKTLKFFGHFENISVYDQKNSLQQNFSMKLALYMCKMYFEVNFSLGVSFYCFLLFCSRDLRMLQIYVPVIDLYMLYSSSVNFVLCFILQLSQLYFTFPSVGIKRTMCKPDA